MKTLHSPDTFTFAIDELVAGEVVEEGVDGVELSDLVFLLNVEHIPLRSQLHSHQTKQTRPWGTIQKINKWIKIDKIEIKCCCIISIQSNRYL